MSCLIQKLGNLLIHVHHFNQRVFQGQANTILKNTLACRIFKTFQNSTNIRWHCRPNPILLHNVPLTLSFHFTIFLTPPPPSLPFYSIWLNVDPLQFFRPKTQITGAWCRDICTVIMSYCKFWTYWVGVNTKFSIWLWQLAVIL